MALPQRSFGPTTEPASASTQLPKKHPKSRRIQGSSYNEYGSLNSAYIPPHFWVEIEECNAGRGVLHVPFWVQDMAINFTGETGSAHRVTRAEYAL